MKQKVTINEGGKWQKNKPDGKPELLERTVDFATHHANEEEKKQEKEKEVKNNAAKKKHTAGKG